MDLDLRSPAKDEEATGEEHGAEHHWWEASFGDGAVVVCFEAGYVEFLVGEVDTGAKEDSD